MRLLLLCQIKSDNYGRIVREVRKNNLKGFRLAEPFATETGDVGAVYWLGEHTGCSFPESQATARSNVRKTFECREGENPQD